jgi:hypothetical protein
MGYEDLGEHISIILEELGVLMQILSDGFSVHAHP